MRLLVIAAISMALMAPTKHIEPLLRSGVALQMPDDKGVVRTFCSGIVAQTVPVPYVITEAHCLDGDDASQMTIKGQGFTEVARSHELVLLRMQGWLADCVPARVAERDSVVGSRVRANGWAFGKFVAQTSGQIAGEYDDELYLDMQFVKGMSGGPVVNDNDEVVTLVRAFQTDASEYEHSPNGFAVGARTQSLRDLCVLMRGWRWIGSGGF